MTFNIDLNSDLGESFGAYKIGLDEEVVPLITSANAACGYHAGDPTVMKKTIILAKEFKVAVGAHIGFPDLLGFGRRNMEVTYDEIRDYATYQIGALAAFAARFGVALQHVKPHGALYNMAVADGTIWEVIAEVMARIDNRLILYAMAGNNASELKKMGQKYGVRIALEFFADRAYNPDGSLVSRRLPGAVIHDHDLAAKRVVRMVKEGLLAGIDGKDLKIQAETVCVHGDNPEAVTLVRTIRTALSRAGVNVVSAGTFI
ncbi:MAG: LamB/YcsF family protein [Deltaproteobacteria bacterium]|nr:LamB/YcsF family protein [Deltaproteobacteria bacterium]